MTKTFRETFLVSLFFRNKIYCIAIIDADEKLVSCEFIGCNENVSPYLIGATTDIQALEQEPCEDAISRQAYIERYRTWGYSEYGRKIDNEELAIRVAMSYESRRKTAFTYRIYT